MGDHKLDDIITAVAAAADGGMGSGEVSDKKIYTCIVLPTWNMVNYNHNIIWNVIVLSLRSTIKKKIK